MLSTRVATTSLAHFLACAGTLIGGLGVGSLRAELGEVTASASTTAMGHSPINARDGKRFGIEPANTWRGAAGEASWWWEAKFDQPESIGAILQITGDHDFVHRNAPRSYVWQVSDDELNWRDLTETRQTNDARSFRVLRLKKVETVRAIRLRIDGVAGDAPVLREIELYPTSDAAIAFPDWIVAVNTTHDGALPGHGQEFIPLAKSCDGWAALQAQQVWRADFRIRAVHPGEQRACGEYTDRRGEASDVV